MHTDNVIQCRGALILGAGIAGLFTALKLAPYPATVVTGARSGHSGSSAWAQGGIAAAVGENDSWEAHARDTMAAGAGACDPAVVELVTRERPGRVVLMTECSMSDNIAALNPDIDFVRPCNLCPHMKRITLDGILHSLQTMSHEVIVAPEVAARAKAPIDRMLAVKA